VTRAATEGPPLVTWWSAAPAPLPPVMPSPFGRLVAPIARVAADELMAWLGAHETAWPELRAPGGGKMFGVLVVRDGAGRVGWLRAFSGKLGGAWTAPGFAPPVFDAAARDAFWPAGEAQLRAMAAEIDGASATPAAIARRERTAALDAELAALAHVHAARKTQRRSVRERGGDAATMLALDQASRADGAERRRLIAAQAEARAALAREVETFNAEQAARQRERQARSRELAAQLRDVYQVTDFTGRRSTIDALYAPASAPGGAGECAAPKLLSAAQARGLVPIALAEFWWGAAPHAGGRVHGQLYPACRGKCGAVVPYMLGGVAVEPAPAFGAAPIAEGEPRVIFEDDWLVVVDKPVGLLSVPGRSAALADSVLARLRQRYPGATGPLLVHRLDLDTSGLLLAAKDEATHRALAAMFARRELTKRYVAWLDGELALARGDAGEIELPLRVDLDDRPRQIVDDAHGKPALTRWRVLARRDGRTLVELSPHTGRTHQLRVHCAHARGLGLAIAGDALYGRGELAAPRLLLHAEALAFAHPRTGAPVVVRAPRPPAFARAASSQPGS
jgi:tRNA pseudouridine32 synthase/23S rRNA pseudouridine746 synthase